MATLQLRVTLEGRGASEAALQELQLWLKDAGVRTQLEMQPPAEEELAGGKVRSIWLAVSLTAEGIHLPAVLHYLDQWPHPTSVVQTVLHLTGQPQHDKDIQEVLKHEGLVHIELREPEWPIREGKPSMIEPPKGK